MNSGHLIKCVLYIIQGVIVGITAILPGVSGGVLCVAFGIYEPMMALLTHPFTSFRTSYKMFVPFLLGWVFGFIFLARGVQVLFERSSTIALMLFFGLICGTLPELFRTSGENSNNQSWTPCILTLSLAYLLFHILENSHSVTMAPSFMGYVISGLVWGLSLIIPGLNSSSLLIFLGLYEPLTRGIGTLDLSVIVPFLIGIIVTVLSLARLVTLLFDRHYVVVSRVILGFVIASSLKIVPDEFESLPVLLAALACFAAGFLVAYTIDRARCRQNDIAHTSQRPRT